jgi:hypothetical protein
MNDDSHYLRQGVYQPTSSPTELQAAIARVQAFTFEVCKGQELLSDAVKLVCDAAFQLEASQDALKDVIQDARSNAEERDGYKKSFEMSLADVLVRQRAADEIVEECAKAADSGWGAFRTQELCAKVCERIRALKGKFLLSAQPNGGLTEEQVREKDVMNVLRKHRWLGPVNMGGTCRCNKWKADLMSGIDYYEQYLDHFATALKASLSEPCTSQGGKNGD